MSKDNNMPMLVVTDHSIEGDALDSMTQQAPRIDTLASEKVVVQEKNYATDQEMDDRVANAQLPTDSKL